MSEWRQMTDEERQALIDKLSESPLFAAIMKEVHGSSTRARLRSSEGDSSSQSNP
jgi:predicted Fe-S protein YdhL (DUF1289 family)